MKINYKSKLVLFFLPVVLPGTLGWKKIQKHFGNDVFQPNGELNREKLGQIIFNDAEKRKILNSITHPEIYKAIAWKVIKNFLLGKIYRCHCH
jgi:dephospho-CoA kinase